MASRLQALGTFVAALALTGCDFSGDWLFGQPVDGLPPVYNITAEDGGPLVPSTIETVDDIAEATIYGEISQLQVSGAGGVTAEFLGTGGPVCIWVDPEVAFWNQAIGDTNAAGEKWRYPDNPWDDGDIDLSVGLSVYYTGSPDRIGDFNVIYEDGLGNPVEIQLQDCPNEAASSIFANFVDAGRGSPESCTIGTTEEGISYTIVLTNWATPIDDDRLGYGLIVMNGTCNNLISVAGRGVLQGQEPNPANEECVITGEALRPVDLGDDEDAYRPWFGFSQVEAAGAVFETSLDFEETFCVGETMRSYCRPEARAVAEEGKACLWENFEEDETFPLEKVKCFCGDLNDTPRNGPG